MIKILRDITFEKADLPAPFQVPQQKPTVEAWETPQDDGLCAKVVFKLNGTNARHEVEYVAYNTEADAEQRAERANSSRFDTRILGEEFYGVGVTNYRITDKKDKTTRAWCWLPHQQESINELHVVCMGVNPLLGVLTIARGDFAPGESRQAAVEQVNDLRGKASRVLAKALLKSSELRGVDRGDPSFERVFDGRHPINIISTAPGTLALLSNFAHIPFELDKKNSRRAYLRSLRRDLSASSHRFALN